MATRVPSARGPFWGSFQPALEAGRASARTVRVYRTSPAVFGAHMSSNGSAPLLEEVDPEDMQGFLACLWQEGKAPHTVAMRYRFLRRFFDWLVSEQEIASSPMERIKPPKLEEHPPPVFSLQELGQLLRLTTSAFSPASEVGSAGVAGQIEGVVLKDETPRA